MTNLPKIDSDYFVDFLVKLLNIPSPTGFSEPAIDFVENELSQFKQLELSKTRKGALVAKWKGESDEAPVALTAHVDTLGAVVKEIKSNGRLKLSRIGGIQWPSVETEGVWVFTSKGEKIRGSVLIDTASGHIYSGSGGETPRNDDHMEVRLDVRTTSEKETRALGISIGDCVAFDPRVEVTNRLIRSRFLDDKACVANIVAAIKSMAEADQSPARRISHPTAQSPVGVPDQFPDWGNVYGLYAGSKHPVCMGRHAASAWPEWVDSRRNLADLRAAYPVQIHQPHVCRQSVDVGRAVCPHRTVRPLPRPPH